MADLYVAYEGKYIDTSYGKKAFEEQLRAVKRKRREREKVRRVLIIVDNIERKEYVEETVAKIRGAEIPLGLKEGIELFTYQKEVLARFQNFYLANPVNGFLLCDDMGFGENVIQLLAFLVWLKDRGELISSLVVAPSTLLNNIVYSAMLIENTLVALWNLVDYNKPGLLGALNEFQRNYVKQTGWKAFLWS